MAPPEARPAATIVVARPGPDPGGRSEAAGIEVLMLRRSPGSSFAPGFLVFPGGSIDEGDAGLARRWFGTKAEAARACALRELAEEAGLVLGRSGLVSMPGVAPGDPGFPAPRIEQVAEMARWIAPDFLPVRFDARFFSVAAPRGLEPHANATEVDGAWWMAPADALRRQREGSVSLMWPTLKVMEALEGCGSVRDVLALRVVQVAPPPPG